MANKTEISDEIVQWGTAVVQHGKLNDRVYLLDPGTEDPIELCARLKDLAEIHGYSRIMAKVPLNHKTVYLNNNFVEEAIIPNLFGSETGVYLAQPRSKDRAFYSNASEHEQILAEVRQKASQPFTIRPLQDGLSIENLGPADCEQISSLLGEVFPSYPFPVGDPLFIQDEMKAGTKYYGIRNEGKLIALSSAECKSKYGAAECTDFGTLPLWRGHGLAQNLLQKMSSDLEEKFQLYTIARACEFGMNLVFARAGWEFCGTLVNSTHIGGQIESMNIWYMR